MTCFKTVPFVAPVSLKQKLKNRLYDKDTSQSHNPLRRLRHVLCGFASAVLAAESERFVGAKSVQPELEHQASYSHGAHG